MPRNKYSKEKAILREILEEASEEAGEAVGFVQRQSKMMAKEFVETLVLGCLEQADASLTDFAQIAADLGVEITGSGIDQRITSKGVELLKSVLERSLKQVVESRPHQPEILRQFNGVYLLDSSYIVLAEHLAELFAGKGGSGSAAGLKLLVSFEYQGGQVMALDIQSGREPDQNCKLHLAWAKPGSLHLFDLGFFKQETFDQLTQRGAFFVSRYQSQTALYWQADDVRGFDVLAFLRSLEGDQADIQVYLGSRSRTPVRVLFQRLPADVVTERRRKARRKMKKEGKVPSQRYLALLEWLILITNIPPENLSFEQLFALYRLRWQIEIIFKTWKSEAGLDKLGPWRPERVLAQFYARLIGLTLFHRLIAPLRFACSRELSFSKAFSIWSRHIPALAQAIARRWRGVVAILERIEGDLSRFALKTSRKKSPSTYQLLLDLGA